MGRGPSLVATRHNKHSQKKMHKTDADGVIETFPVVCSLVSRTYTVQKKEIFKSVKCQLIIIKMLNRYLSAFTYHLHYCMYQNDSLFSVGYVQ